MEFGNPAARVRPDIQQQIRFSLPGDAAPFRDRGCRGMIDGPLGVVKPIGIQAIAIFQGQENALALVVFKYGIDEGLP